MTDRTAPGADELYISLCALWFGVRRLHAKGVKPRRTSPMVA
jgi:hypothetical protein